MCSDFATKQKTDRSGLGQMEGSRYGFTGTCGFSRANLKVARRGSACSYNISGD
ncbi:hypothetical protein RCH06_000806 [Polaromonas sp. CG_9.5]|nr:hypothetical protein [Polaromonas sp. CG_9.5]